MLLIQVEAFDKEGNQRSVPELDSFFLKIIQLNKKSKTYRFRGYRYEIELSSSSWCYFQVFSDNSETISARKDSKHSFFQINFQEKTTTPVKQPSYIEEENQESDIKQDGEIEKEESIFEDTPMLLDNKDSQYSFDFMLSYKITESGEFTKKLGKYLTSKGYRVFIGEENLKGGGKWISEIGNAIKHCKVFVAILTEKYGSTKMD